MKKAYIGFAVAAVVASIVFFAWNHKRQADLDTNKEPYSGISDILKAREEKAALALNSDAGKWLVNKQWVSLRSSFETLDPSSALDKLGELIRAIYIQNLYQSYTPEDFNQILLLSIQIIGNSSNEILRKNGPFLTQFYRLPAPSQGSEAHSLLLAGLQNGNWSSLAKEIMVLKSIKQDGNPNPKVQSGYRNFLSSKVLKGDSIDASSWLRSIAEIRSPQLREEYFQWLHQNFSSLSDSLKGEALQTLSLYPTLEATKLKKLIPWSITSKNSKIVEGGLTCIGALARDQLATKDELALWAKDFTKIPTPLRSGYVDRKIDEILQMMSKM